jgi:hypothetical protein
MKRTRYNTGLMRTLEQVLRWIVIIGAYLLPFVVFYVASNLFFPFITGKNFYFRIVVEIMAAAWLSLACVIAAVSSSQKLDPGRICLICFIMALADAFGANPVKSFWSNFERMDGWVTIAHTFVYLVVAASVLNDRKFMA